MLQFTQKQGRVKRKALLVNKKGGLDLEALKSEVANEEGPQPLPGDAFERMRSDPELAATKRRLVCSAGIVLGLVVVAAIINLNYENWFPDSGADIPLPVADDAPAVSSSTVARGTHIGMAARPDRKPEKLDFTAPETPEQPRITSAPSVVNPASQGPPQLGARNPIPGGAATPRVPGLGQGGRGAATLRNGNMAASLPKALYRVATGGPSIALDHNLTKAKAALTAFLKAPTVNQRISFVADRATVEPRMRNHYARFGDGPAAFQAIKESVVVGNGAMSEHDIVFADGRLHRATVVRAGDGSYLVDWPSFVLESEMDWLEFMDKKPSQPVMFRASAEAGDFFDADFSDARWLMCIKLQNPARPEVPPIFAYVERQSVLGRETEYWLRLSEGQAVPMTIRLRFPPVATHGNQVWLTDLVTMGWVVGESRPVVEARRGTVGFSN